MEAIFEGAIERTSEKAQSLALPKSPFDETLLGLTIFLLSFPRARTPSKCEGDRKAFGYPGNLRYESLAAGVRRLRKALAYRGPSVLSSEFTDRHVLVEDGATQAPGFASEQITGSVIGRIH